MASDRLETVFNISRKGQIEALRIDAVITETHHRQSEVTEYPVEDGVAISDHVKLNPISIDMNCFISDAPANYFGIRDLSDIAEDVINTAFPRRGQRGEVPNAESRSPIDAWNYLTTVWLNRYPITVISSLQIYRNMILTKLTAPKSVATGKSLEFQASLKEVRIVTRAETTLPALTLANENQAGKVNEGKQLSLIHI